MLAKLKLVHLLGRRTWLLLGTNFCESLIIRTGAIKDFGVFSWFETLFSLNCGLYTSASCEVVGLISATTFLTHVFTVFWSYILTHCSCIGTWMCFRYMEYLYSADASRLERVQRKFLAPCYNRTLPQINYSYVNDLCHHTLCARRCYCWCALSSQCFFPYRNCWHLHSCSVVHIISFVYCWFLM